MSTFIEVHAVYRRQKSPHCNTGLRRSPQLTRELWTSYMGLRSHLLHIASTDHFRNDKCDKVHCAFSQRGLLHNAACLGHTSPGSQAAPHLLTDFLKAGCQQLLLLGQHRS